MPNILPPILSSEQCAALFALSSALNAQQLDRASAWSLVEQAQLLIPQGKLDLVWEMENLGPLMTYSLILSLEQEVYSINSSSRNVLPWPLRGSVQADSDVLLRVDGYSLSIAQVIRLLDPIWNSAELMTRIIDTALLSREFERRPVSIPDEDIDSAMQRFFKTRSGTDAKAEDTWLQKNGLSRGRLRGMLHDVLAQRRIERMLIQTDFEAQFREQRNNYLGMRVAQLRVPSDIRAEIEAVLKMNTCSGLLALGKHMTWSMGSEDASRIEFVELFAYELAERSRQTFGLPVGAVCLVEMADGDARIIEICGYETGVSEHTLQRRIERKLIREWCEKQRKSAHIEWHWGRTDAQHVS